MDVAKSYGFEPVSPEELTMAEQIQLFQGADNIIASTGAALTNLQFIHPGANVIIMYNMPNTAPLWSSIIAIKKGNLWELADESIIKHKKAYQRDFYINPMNLKQILDTINIINKNK